MLIGILQLIMLLVCLLDTWWRNSTSIPTSSIHTYRACSLCGTANVRCIWLE